MASKIAVMWQAFAAMRRGRRRRANLRAGSRAAAPAGLRTRDAPAGPRTTGALAGPRIAGALVKAAPPLRPVAPQPMALTTPTAAAARSRASATPRPPWTAVSWIGLAGVLAALAGAGLLALHARLLGAATDSAPAGADAVRPAAAYQALLPGVAFSVPATPTLSLTRQQGGALLVVAGLRGAAPVRVDLCSQLLDPAKPRLAPLRLGYRFEDVQRWVARSQAAGSQAALPAPLRNVLLVADTPDAGAAAMPEVQISGLATPDFADPLSQPLQLTWHGQGGAVRWIGDASFGLIEDGEEGQVGLRQQGWLLWGGAAALRIERRRSAACPQAGELVLQLFHAAASASVGLPQAAPKALVTAFAARQAPVSAYLAAGRYLVPPMPARSLEDQALFRDLLARGLLRRDGGGAIAVVPRDLAVWRAGGAAGQAAALSDWRGVQLDTAGVKLIKRLYQQADGAYVRQQIDVYNSELRLLAWRARQGDSARWEASFGATPASVSAEMPGAAARLFAQLPQDWQPWNRVATWPQADAAAPTPMTLTLPLPASAGDELRLMLVGRVASVSGARLRTVPACSGRACPSADAAQQLFLQPLPGARQVQLRVLPLALASLGGAADQPYRHVVLGAGAGAIAPAPVSATAPAPASAAAPAPASAAASAPASASAAAATPPQLRWQALAPGLATARPRAPVPVLLQDRNGALLWADGAPTAAALEAGLAPMLGLNPEHANSVAGMLSRLPAPATARMTLDLPLQTLSQQLLECLGMRRGRWDGAHCGGGHAAPPQRHAGLVIVDAENGDVLAAAGAGAGTVTPENWAEVRDFDQANPARSPLRLPALQHDGGAHQSPGSTFKVISALGLELAARDNPQIDALLGGLPLAAINRMAQQRGFAFQTDAATYPFTPNSHAARITNYHEQSLDRRAHDGRLGLAQALTYSLNTWFAWSGELSDRSLFGRADGGAPDLQPLEPQALDAVRPIVAAAHRLGFEQALRLDGGLLPADFNWSTWDALQSTASHIDTIHTRHELRQMSIGLRMQATPLQMALAAAAIGQGQLVAPRLLLALDGAQSRAAAPQPLGIRLDRIRAGMKGVIDAGTGAGAFGGAALAGVRRGLYGKTGTAPSVTVLPDGSRQDGATVWFTGWLEPGTLPGQAHRLAMAVFVSHSEASGGEHAAPVLAALLTQLARAAAPAPAPQLARNREQRVK